jgi:hypothetical protein
MGNFKAKTLHGISWNKNTFHYIVESIVLRGGEKHTLAEILRNIIRPV